MKYVVMIRRSAFLLLTGVEGDTPGTKDHGKVRKFLENAKTVAINANKGF